MKMVLYPPFDPTEVGSLIPQFYHRDPRVRLHARQSLARIGAAAIPGLVEMLADVRYWVRWEAVKTLSEMGDPRAAPALIQVLEDDRPSIRWLAAEGLINLGLKGLTPLLEASMQHSASVRLREGAHHVLRVLVEKRVPPAIVMPVLAALEDVEPTIELPLAAHAALKKLTLVPD